MRLIRPLRSSKTNPAIESIYTPLWPKALTRPVTATPSPCSWNSTGSIRNASQSSSMSLRNCWTLGVPCNQLLQQPQGFERLGSRREFDLADAPPVAERVDLVLQVVDLDAAEPAAAAVAHDHEELVPGVDELLGDGLQLLPFGVPAPPHVADRGRAVRGQLLTNFPDHVRCEVQRCFLVVAAAVGVQAPARGFDVRLRHRLLRQPHGFEGLVLAAEEGPPSQLALSQSGGHPHRLFDLPCGERCCQPRLHDRPVTRPAGVEHLPTWILESAEHRLPPRTHTSVATKGAPFGFR